MMTQTLPDTVKTCGFYSHEHSKRQAGYTNRSTPRPNTVDRTK